MAIWGWISHGVPILHRIFTIIEDSQDDNCSLCGISSSDTVLCKICDQVENNITIDGEGTNGLQPNSQTEIEVCSSTAPITSDIIPSASHSPKQSKLLGNIRDTVGFSTADIQISEVEQHLSKPSGNGKEETDKPAVGFGHERRVLPSWRLKKQQLQEFGDEEEYNKESIFKGIGDTKDDGSKRHIELAEYDASLCQHQTKQITTQTSRKSEMARRDAESFEPFKATSCCKAKTSSAGGSAPEAGLAEAGRGQYKGQTASLAATTVPSARKEPQICTDGTKICTTTGYARQYASLGPVDAIGDQDRMQTESSPNIQTEKSELSGSNSLTLMETPEKVSSADRSRSRHSSLGSGSEKSAKRRSRSVTCERQKHQKGFKKRRSCSTGRQHSDERDLSSSATYISAIDKTSIQDVLSDDDDLSSIIKPEDVEERFKQLALNMPKSEEIAAKSKRLAQGQREPTRSAGPMRARADLPVFSAMSPGKDNSTTIKLQKISRRTTKKLFNYRPTKDISPP